MTGHESGPETSQTRRRIATVIAVVGVAVVGGQLARAWPRNVEVVYELDSDIERLDVDYVEDGEAVASARFHVSEGETPVFRHTVRLRPGEYQAEITTYRHDGRGTEYGRLLTVPTGGVTRFDLRE